jgi:hypothetical protein
MATRIAELIGAPAERARLGAANRARIEAGFTPRRMADTTVAVLTELWRERTEGNTGGPLARLRGR